jgi:predicted transcriptional regulator
MTHYDDGSWREDHLSREQWEQVALRQWLGRSPYSLEEIEARLQTEHEMGLLAQVIMLSALTLRQRQVVELYCMEGRTQVEVAKVLAISQATVSQHLMGKLRNGHYVGGAFRKIRKAIHKAAKLRAGDDTRPAQILAVFDELLDSAITRHRASEIIKRLSRSRKMSDL